MAEQVNDDKKYTDVRLPTNFKPCHYDICLKPDFDKFTFEGKIKIEYERIGSSDNSIVLHANELVISNGTIQSDSGKCPKLKTVTYSKTSETATLEFDDAIDAKGTMCLTFSGTLNDKLRGFYRTSFKIDGSDVLAATTHFEPTDARRCFPCFDEPAIRATFSIGLVINKFMTINGKQYERLALSNMPEISRSGPDDQLEVRFAKTPSMSTYLLAFVVGPFEFVEGTDSRRPIRVYTTPGKKEQGAFALEVACMSLPYYEDYFKVPYPLPKMDLIAIPDFPIGAMENWGLVTYRETCLLVDPQNTATSVKQYVALVVAHELAHQWFGNLVTLSWWTHLWLKEGFASFMEYMCVDHILPDYDIWSQFVTDAYGQALNLDSLHSSHPIEVPVGHPSEIREIFDTISYKKGASVIRMLHHYIGDDFFRAGMNDYLTKFAYKSATTEDLWDSLEAASNKPVRKLMPCWTGLKGYPWVFAFRSGPCAIVMVQKKFTADGKLSDEEAALKWMIPISYSTGENPTVPLEGCLLSPDDGKDLKIVREPDDYWVKLNPGTVGLYRTAYDDELMAKLLAAIVDQTLPPMDRLGLQDDLFALSRAGKVGTIELLKLLQSFRNETNYTVWQSIDGCIDCLDLILSETDYHEKFHAFGRELYGEIFKKITWSTPANGEKWTDRMTRSLVANRLISFGDKNVVDEALRKYKAHVDKTDILPADLRSAVYKAVAIYGDDLSFESLFAIFRTEDLHEEKNRVARSLGFSHDSERQKKALNFALSNEVRNQDKVQAIRSVGITNPQLAWQFFKDNKNTLTDIYEGGIRMCSLVEYCTENFMTEEKAREVEQFFSENNIPGVERTVQQSLETIRVNANWLARDGDKMKTFFP